MEAETEQTGESQASVSADIQSILVHGTQTVAGFFAKPMENPVKALGVVIQYTLQRDLFGGLKEGMEFLAKEGRVKPDYFDTAKGRATLQEVLKALNEDDIDEERFKAMRAIFLSAATDGEADNTVLILTLMRLVNKLSTSEVVTLRAVWRFWQEFSDPNSIGDRNLWPDFLRKHTGLTFELTDEDVRNLAEKRLLSDPVRYGARQLTNTGSKLCDYLVDPTST